MGDGLGMDLKLSNQVFNSLKQHCYSEQRRSARLHEKKEHSTSVRARAHARAHARPRWSFQSSSVASR